MPAVSGLLALGFMASCEEAGHLGVLQILDPALEVVVERFPTGSAERRSRC
jgi:hypothetical protein